MCTCFILILDYKEQMVQLPGLPPVGSSDWKEIFDEEMQEYVEVRLALAADPSIYESGITRSEEIQAELWAILEENVRQGKESDIMALYIEAINEVIDVHLLRLTAANLRLPSLLVMVLYAAMILSFLLVEVANSGDGKRDFIAVLLFALAFVGVLMIIVDLDRPQEGLVTVNQTAMSDLLQSMTSPLR